LHHGNTVAEKTIGSSAKTYFLFAQRKSPSSLPENAENNGCFGSAIMGN
jgi:hypothetical protein